MQLSQENEQNNRKKPKHPSGINFQWIVSINIYFKCSVTFLLFKKISLFATMTDVADDYSVDGFSTSFNINYNDNMKYYLKYFLNIDF